MYIIYTQMHMYTHIHYTHTNIHTHIEYTQLYTLIIHITHLYMQVYTPIGSGAHT